MLFLLATISSVTTSQVTFASNWPPTGSYHFTDWPGPALDVFYTIPPEANERSPILIVIPGARRDANVYRDQWDQLAAANHFITLVVGASANSFPTEYEYNLGVVINAVGEAQPEEKWLYSAINPLFEEFKTRFGSSRETYDLYGHSAGGGFVHRFLIFKPQAKVKRAVAANAAFVTMPTIELDFPFGPKETSLPVGALHNWLDKELVILLGDSDINPRNRPLSNGQKARLQGPHVFTRGLNFFSAALTVAIRSNTLSGRLKLCPALATAMRTWLRTR